MSSNTDMAGYFDRLAPDWGRSPAEYDVREKLISMMGLLPGGVICDIGCGNGVLLEHLLKFSPAKVIAVDISSEMIRMAKAFCGDSRVEYFNGDFLSAGLPALDAAVAFNSYPHFLDKPAFVEKTAQAIKIDGILAIAHSSGKKTINSRHGGGSAAALSIPLESAEAEAGRFKRFFAPETLIDNDGMYFIKLRRK